MRLRTKALFINSLRIIAIGVLFHAEVAHAEDAPGVAGKPADAVRVLQTKMIWDAAPHNAFTDLVRWTDRWYCSFREGSAHASYDGTIRILGSSDGDEWHSVAQFAEKGLDLRDPKLCVLPDGRLLVGVGVRKQDERNPANWHTTSRVLITNDGQKWDSHTVGDAQVWMWRFVTHGEYVYSFGYRQVPKGLGGETFLNFYRSRDGATWEKIAKTEAGGGYVNEAAFVFQPDNRCVVLLRREGGNNRLGLARPPYTDWTWSDLEARFNGPALLRLPDGRILAGGRSKELGAPMPKTTVGWLITDPPELRPLQWLPSQHETGYPGLALYDGQIWVSYYSSESGKCSIYMAQVELANRE